MRKRGPYFRKAANRSKKPPKANKIREWREYFALSQEELAGETGLSVASISAYEQENGGNEPSVSALKRLSDAFGVPRGMILDIDPNDAPGKYVQLRIPPPAKR